MRWQKRRPCIVLKAFGRSIYFIKTFTQGTRLGGTPATPVRHKIPKSIQLKTRKCLLLYHLMGIKVGSFDERFASSLKPKQSN